MSDFSTHEARYQATMTKFQCLQNELERLKCVWLKHPATMDPKLHQGVVDEIRKTRTATEILFSEINDTERHLKELIQERKQEEALAEEERKKELMGTFSKRDPQVEAFEAALDKLLVDKRLVLVGKLTCEKQHTNDDSEFTVESIRVEDPEDY